MEQIIIGKLFTAFTEIVLELIKMSDMEPSTKMKINDSIVSICGTLTSLNLGNLPKTMKQPVTPDPIASRTRDNKGQFQRKEEPEINRKGKQTKSSKNLNTEPVTPTVSLLNEENNNSSQIILDGNQNPSTSGTALESELVANVPEKKLFLSNFPSNATDTAIKNHLVRKIPNFSVDVDISKIKFGKERNYTHPS